MILPPAGDVNALLTRARVWLKLGTRGRTARDRLAYYPMLAAARLRREGLDGDREALIQRVLDGARAASRVMSDSAPGARLLELDGVTAAVLPALPERSVMNTVVYTDVEALLGHALADAAERGATTSTLVATPEGRSRYARQGCHDLGPLEQWERRS